MKTVIMFVFLMLMGRLGLGQNNYLDHKIDSLQTYLKKPNSDSINQQIVLSLAGLLVNKAWTKTNSGDFSLAYQSYMKAFELLEKPEVVLLFKNSKLEKPYWTILANTTFNYGHLMGTTGNAKEAELYYQKSYDISIKWNDAQGVVYGLSGLAYSQQKNNELGIARSNIEKAISYPPQLYDSSSYAAILYINGIVNFKSGRILESKVNFISGIKASLQKGDQYNFAVNTLALSKFYQKLNLADSSYSYGIQSLQTLRKIREIQMFDIDLATAYENLFIHFEQFNQPDSAAKYLKLAYVERNILTKKKLSQMAKFQQMLVIKERKLSIIEKENINLQNKFRTYLLLSLLAVFILIGAIIFWNYKQKQKANLFLARQKDEIESTLENLKSTQAQLIQSEKMASLGELTAGIAHEIQNPLNFVNNFSEVSEELIEEVLGERLKVKGERDEKLEEEILGDIKDNLQKIHHHGNRASSIVKGMLEHSRTSSGKKELTDINALADEYLRLAYHGLRAKDQNGSTPRFNADFKTNFDENLPKIEVVPQDIGRVLLNLINNGFQAVDEQAKKGIEGYKPTLKVSTKSQGDQVIISVKDNGSGIPDTIKDKIFQPFFTTKDTGKGTGLGLSLAYDIVKAHGGEIIVESKEGEGTELTIRFSQNNTE